MGRLSGKVAIVTASTGGIGLAIAEKLAQEGAKVVVSSRKEKNVSAAVENMKREGLMCAGCVCHVGKKEDREKLIQTAIQEFGGIDIVVCNAGVNPAFGPIMDTTEEEYDKIMDTNVKATFFLCQEAYPHLQKRGGGSIILISSIAGYQPKEFFGIYGTSKTALLGLTKAMASQLAKSNIRVNGVAPGLIKTKMSRAIWENKNAIDASLSSYAIKRIGRPEECAGIVAFLASDEASYITAETVVVAGGVHSHL